MSLSRIHMDLDRATFVTIVLALVAVVAGALPMLVSRLALQRRVFAGIVVGGVVLALIPFVRADAAPSAAAFSFNPVTGNTRACETFTGSGKIPKGYQLLVFDRADGGLYYLDGPATSIAGGWQSPRVSVGDTSVEVAAALVTSEEYAFLKSVRPIGNDGKPVDGVWKTSQLPGDVVDQPLIVHPDPNDTQTC